MLISRVRKLKQMQLKTKAPFKYNKLLAFLGLFVLLLAIWGFLVEPNMLVINRQNIKIKNLPKEYIGMKVLVLGDIHAGSPHIDEKKLDKIVELSNKEKPDLVLLLGDFEREIHLGKFIPTEVVARKFVNIKNSRGIISVLGNHEWWNDGEESKKGLIKHGITFLENQSLNIAKNGEAPLWIAGLADATTRKIDINSALKPIKDEETVIMLSHTPDTFPNIPKSVDLTLAGHVHGGQIRLPFIGAIIVPSQYGNRYSKGHIVEDGKQLFVTSGIGTSILPVRFLCPPEIVVLTLYN